MDLDIANLKLFTNYNLHSLNTDLLILVKPQFLWPNTYDKLFSGMAGYPIIVSKLSFTACENSLPKSLVKFTVKTDMVEHTLH